MAKISQKEASKSVAREKSARSRATRLAKKVKELEAPPMQRLATNIGAGVAYRAIEKMVGIEIMGVDLADATGLVLLGVGTVMDGQISTIANDLSGGFMAVSAYNLSEGWF